MFRSTENGTCHYCCSENEHLVETNILADKFRGAMSAYSVAEEGKSIVQWLREDWSLFLHPRMDDAHAKELLADILDDGEIVRRLFVPVQFVDEDHVGRWEELRKELMRENRFFPATQIDLNRLELLLTRLVLDISEIPKRWYRARIQTGDAAYSPNEMMAPPNKVATHGRANPAGNPYLYLGSEIITAASEVRAHTGETICVAGFDIAENLELVDLRNPRLTISPFSLADMIENGDEIGKLRSDIGFLESLGQELTRPVLPHAAAFDYTPSQYLCEFIKKCGYDGVAYSSSVNDGINLALFRPEKTQIGNILQRKVTQVSVTVA